MTILVDHTRCIHCCQEYKANENNTKIYGPYVDITCPLCGDVYTGKLLNLVDRLFEKPRASMKGASLMQSLAQYIEKNSVENSKGKGKPGKETKKPPKDKKDKKKK
jgi:hypothetical protein